MPKFIDSLKETLDDKIFLYVAIAAVISMLIGEFNSLLIGWIEGFSILVTIVIIILVQTWVDKYKD